MGPSDSAGVSVASWGGLLQVLAATRYLKHSRVPYGASDSERPSDVHTLFLLASGCLGYAHPPTSPKRTPLRSSVSHWPTASQPHATTNTASQGSLWIRDSLTSETGETWFMALVCLSSPLLAIRPPAELAETPRFICTPSNHHGRTRTPPLKQRHSTGDRETPSGLTTGRREDAGTRELGPPGTGPPEHHAVADSFTGTYRHCQAQARASNPYYHLQIKRPPHATTLLSLLEEQRLPKQHWPRGKAIQDPMQIQPSCCLVRLRLVRLALLFPLLLCMTFGHISCP